MGVYGTSAPLDSFDIDYDDEEDEVQYILCTNCGEEYCEEELLIMNEDNLYQENVCESCINRYKEMRENLISEIVNDYLRDMWNEGNVHP